MGFRECYGRLAQVVDGSEALQLKGLSYLSERVHNYQSAVKERLADTIDQAMDEKRNLISFSLTIVTAMLAPLTVLTGYWGMNFDNMVYYIRRVFILYVYYIYFIKKI